MKQKKKNSLTVAMITRNEEKAISGVISEIKRYVSLEDEVLVVDSSSDRTAQKAKDSGATVVRQFPPRGYGPAMMEALNLAKNGIVITLDADGTYPVEYIPVLRKMVEEGVSVVNASRLMGKPKAMPWINYLANAACALIASLLYGIWTTDLHSGMRAYDKKILNVIKFDGSKPALPVDLWLKPKLLGYNTKEIFIPYKERIGESKMNPLKGLYWTLYRIINTRFIK